jgi:hypothetical protein
MGEPVFYCKAPATATVTWSDELPIRTTYNRRLEQPAMHHLNATDQEAKEYDPAELFV